jgi:hypothetical protein
MASRTRSQPAELADPEEAAGILDSEKIMELELQQQRVFVTRPPPAVGLSRHARKGSMDQSIESDLEEARPAAWASEWTGPDDQENPLNWSLLKRRCHVIPPAIISFAA